MTHMETNVELEVLDDAELDEVTGGFLDFSGIRTFVVRQGGTVVGANQTNDNGSTGGGLVLGIFGVQVNVV